MRKFGISGSWSFDCAGPFRVKYSTPLFGKPTMTVGSDGNVYTLSEVQEAVRVSEEKRKLLVLMKKQETPNLTLSN